MVKEELISRSPVRAFMQSIHGGLKPGEMGIIAAPRGLGKTSVLVQIALDKLLRGKRVIHVSFTQHTDYVLAWYENIFHEFIKKKNLEDEGDIRDEIVKNRVLMKFNQDGVTVDQIIRSLRALIREGGFQAEALIIDGLAFAEGGRESLGAVKAFAEEAGLGVWYSCTVGERGDPGKGLYDQRNIPLLIRDYEDLFAVVVVLQPHPDHIALWLAKDRERYNPEQSALRLDPRTLLILE